VVWYCCRAVRMLRAMNPLYVYRFDVINKVIQTPQTASHTNRKLVKWSIRTDWRHTLWGVGRWKGTRTHPTSRTRISGKETMKGMTMLHSYRNKPLHLSDWDQTKSPQTKITKTFLHVCHIWTIPQAHKRTAQLSFLCYTLRVLFLPLSDRDQTTSPQNQVL
jgi:hypothetical protein